MGRRWAIERDNISSFKRSGVFAKGRSMNAAEVAIMR